MRIPRTAATTLAAVAATAVLAPASFADDCPNAGIRAKQKASQLGECRAYEMVSPTDKGGNQINEKGTTMAAPSGDAVAYSSPGAFAGALASVIQGHYIGRRAASGWSVDPVEAPQDHTVGNVATPTRFFSESLDRAIQVSAAPLTPGATAGGSNVYRRDNITGARNLVATGASSLLMLQMADLALRPPVAATPDLSHFLFQSATQLLPEAAPGVNNAYEVVGDELRLAGVLPDGSVPSGGSQVSLLPGMNVNRSVTPDGRRVFFTSPEGTLGALYVRENGATKLISRSYLPEDDPTTPKAAIFAGASDDGDIVYFASDYRLLPTAPDSGSRALYRYDVAADDLEIVSASAVPAEPATFVSYVYAVSDDGSTVYFHAKGRLVPEAAGQTWGLYRRDEQGVRLVADVGDADLGAIAISPNLRHVAFESANQPTGFDNHDQDCRYSPAVQVPDGRCTEIFVYDAVTEQLRCASCVEGSPDNAHATLNPQAAFHSQYLPRAVLDDGRVFFTTAEGIVPSDVNGMRDVYLWRDGKVDLVSSGRGESDSVFAEASSDGDSVFMVTGQRLVATDVDDSNDLYVARVDGGVAKQNEPPAAPPGCDGDACQPPSVAPPSLLSTAPVDFGAPAPRDRGPVAPAVRRSGIARGAAVRLTVRVSGGGAIRVSGPGLVTSSRPAGAAGSYRLVVRLSRQARRKLKRDRRLSIRTTVRFTSTQGLSSVKRLSLTFKAAPKRKGR